VDGAEVMTVMRTFLKGTVVGGVTSALVMAATAAVAGSGVGAVFNLGRTNSVNRTSVLVGRTAGAMLRVQNKGSGPAASFQVAAGKAPFAVNSNVKVGKLNADLLDGVDSTGFYAAGSKVIDSLHADEAHHSQGADVASTAGHANTAGFADNADALGGLPASFYVQKCTHGTVEGYAVVPGDLIGSIYQHVVNAFNCKGPFVDARRASTGVFYVKFDNMNMTKAIAFGNVEADPDDFLGWEPTTDPLTQDKVLKITIVNHNGNFQDRRFSLMVLLELP